MSRADATLAALRKRGANVRSTGPQSWEAYCPACGSAMFEERCLRISENGRGAIVRCSRGCQPAVIMAALGLMPDGRTPAEAAERLTLIPANSVKPENPPWLDKPRIALAALTMLVGKPGLGKSTALVERAARATRGELPGDMLHTACPVLIATAEDTRPTLVARLIAAGADLTRTHFVTAGATHPVGLLTLPDDTEALGIHAEEVGAKLVGIDPMTAFFSPEVNSHRDTDVRRVLAALAQMAERHVLAVVAVLHLNKSAVADVLSRVSGSVAFTAAARSVLVLESDPNEPEGPGRILAHAKSNLAERAPSLACRLEPREITDEDGAKFVAPRLVVVGQSDVTADDLLRDVDDDHHPTKTEEAVDFIRTALASGPVPAGEMFDRGRKAGLSERTLKRAKAKLHVRSGRPNDRPGEEWVWFPPGDDSARS